MLVIRRSNKTYGVKKTWVEKYQMSFSDGLCEMGLDELGLGREREREIYSQKQANSEKA